MIAVRTALAAVLVASLAGCPQEVPPMAPADTPMPTESNFIHGRASYLERIKIPPGADFTVQLIDNQLADTPKAVIATTTLEDVAGPPYDFALQYDPAKLRPNGQYGLSATLRGADGGLLFVTGTRVPVTIGDTKVVEFRMVRASAGDAPQPAAQLNRTQWTCGGMTFAAVFDMTNGRVELALPDGALSLPQAVSASGARYNDHLGNEFWTKGSSGTLTRAGGKKSDCVQADAKPASGSVWDKAKARGIAFRAIGTEPGWLVEVGQGETPMLHAELDYGEHKFDAKVQMLSGLLGYASTQGQPMRLVLERKACSDGMSDERYPVDATFEVGAKRYRGCGRFLD
ncbi:hypothetical protein LYSHEL_31120 [Lysobacter helvus]|uniref:C-type lysozyme inhibitor domain-containing protein n=2 Tax=Lysobacteraceae TaxID=32033 RepID=A0ABN6FWQ1_9GAMM|nr:MULTISPECIES: YbaY family lipoprotein [Lysobacter]BCT94085.1 hypothetical protein LYSCAS_31090 [Lysobacter caseinilyticus]BCT97241.1 hypothetical protein LYSHEL_31120 [Lysobacter helvus]